MILEDKWSWKRFYILLLMTAATGAMTVGTLFWKKLGTGQWLLVALCGVVLSVLLALCLEWERKEQGIFHEKSNNFIRIGIAYIICCALVAIFGFLPDYIRPIMLPAVVMTMVSSSVTGMISGCYFSILLCFAGDGNAALLACYLLLSVTGCVIARFLQDRKSLFWSSFMILTITFCISTLCSVLDLCIVSIKELIFGIVNGMVSGCGVLLIFRLYNDKIIHGKEDCLEEIISDEYSLVQTMQNYSKADYEHARKVSRIAAGCAEAIGADRKLSAAAGFYYRVGRLEGEPFVENGVELAKKHDFPPELILILAEYNGEHYAPSTVESALVHMVDNVVAKFDVLDRTTLSSSWNQDIVVYQTLNENSASGLYDKSGLGMNMFLIIRDYLIKEAGLYDSNH